MSSKEETKKKGSTAKKKKGDVKPSYFLEKIYRTNEPYRWDQLIHCESATNMLRRLSERKDYGHLAIIGPPGSGKVRRIRTFLQEMYGMALPLQKTEFHFQPQKDGKEASSSEESDSSKRKGGPQSIEILQSARHIEVNITEWKGAVQEAVLKNLIKTQTTSQNLQSMLLKDEKEPKMKLLVIGRAETLELKTQHCILDLCERYVQTLRIIFVVTGNQNQFITPLQSRCTWIRVQAPTADEVKRILQDEYVGVPALPGSSQYLDSQIKSQVAAYIADRNQREGNLHCAISMFRRTMEKYYETKEKNDENASTKIAIILPLLLKECEHFVECLLDKDADTGHLIRLDAMFKALMGKGYLPQELFRHIFSILPTAENFPIEAYSPIAEILLDFPSSSSTVSLEETFHVLVRILRVIQSARAQDRISE